MAISKVIYGGQTLIDLTKTAFYEKATVKTDIKAISSGTVTADIRDLTGEYYVGVSGRRVASSTMRFTITKIWLE